MQIPSAELSGPKSSKTQRNLHFSVLFMHFWDKSFYSWRNWQHMHEKCMKNAANSYQYWLRYENHWNFEEICIFHALFMHFSKCCLTKPFQTMENHWKCMKTLSKYLRIMEISRKIQKCIQKCIKNASKMHEKCKHSKMHQKCMKHANSHHFFWNMKIMKIRRNLHFSCIFDAFVMHFWMHF